MSKRKNRQAAAKSADIPAVASRPEKPRPAESQLVEVATVGWMLATLVTLASEMVVALFALWRWLAPENQTPAMLVELFGFCAFVVGTVSLLPAALVLRLRRVPPPRSVTVVALIVGILPLVVVCCRLWH